MLWTLWNAELGRAENAAQAEAGKPKSGEEYWQKLRQAAENCFGGIDATVEISSGVERREFANGTKTGPFGEARITVPIFSGKNRRETREAKRTFLEHGAKLINELEEARAAETILKEQADALKTALVEEGLSGIEAYYQLRERLEKARAAVRAGERKIEGWVADCDH